jgi:hypothetical protein
MLRHVTGAAVAAWGLSGLGWLGLAAWSLRGDAAIGPICRASGGALDDALRPELLLGTTLMMLAMMAPLTAGPMHHLWHRSLARHRLRAIGLFWLTYIALWSLVGVLFALAAANASRIGNTVLLTLLIALAWQRLPAKATALRRCHLRPPLAVFGARAPRSTVVCAAADRMVRRVVLGRDGSGACGTERDVRPRADADRECDHRVGAALAHAAAVGWRGVGVASAEVVEVA